MSDRMRILQAIGQADDGDLLDTEKILGIAGGRPVTTVQQRKILRTVLIAAILSVIFIGVAFATGFFGLMDRLVPGRNPRESFRAAPSYGTEEAIEITPRSGYLPAYGFSNSPEAQANAEYMDMFLEFIAKRKQGDAEADLQLPTADEELEKIESIYFVFNREMTAKLLQIADKYGLKLYTNMIFPRSLEEFYALAGTEPFFLPAEDTGSISCNYIFEDGAFMCEGHLDIAGGNGMGRYDGADISFSLTRGMPGYLYPFLRFVEEPDAYEEWSYVTAHGDTVSIAWRTGEPDPLPMGENGEDTFDHVYIFYEENQRTISVNCTVYDGMSVERAQTIADCFDFSAACQGQPHILPAIEAAADSIDHAAFE